MHSFLFAKSRRHYAKVINCTQLRMRKQFPFHKKRFFLKINNIFYFGHDIYTKLFIQSESLVKIKVMSLQLFFVLLVTWAFICKQRLLHGKEIVLNNIFKTTNDVMKLTDPILKGIYKVLKSSCQSATLKEPVQFFKLFHDGDPYHIETSSSIYRANQ